ncbi:MAG: hypothetical protein HC853_03550 [Anaerolineae bacterium]|nr:hypothetical protein [Anaerolineae bacterium]
MRLLIACNDRRSELIVDVDEIVYVIVDVYDNVNEYDHVYVYDHDYINAVVAVDDYDHEPPLALYALLPPMIPINSLISIAIGGVLLMLGRRMYFVFVAGVFFLLGLGLANLVLGEISFQGWSGTIIGLVVGAIAALLAMRIQETVLRIVGALAGAGGTYMLVSLLNISLGGYWWAAVIAGGVLGFILVIGIFDLALVLLSSYAGANLILNGARGLMGEALTPTYVTLGLLVLMGIGLVVQLGSGRAQR